MISSSIITATLIPGDGISRMVVAGLTMACLTLVTPSVNATQILFAPGVTSEGGGTASLGIGRNWNLRWFESNTGHLGGYWHAGYTWWEGGQAGNAAHSVSFSPVLVYTFNAENWRPFIEFGIGAALFSRQMVGDKNLGSAAHFEDRFGAGLHLGERSTLMLRVIHYSNAGLASPNQGIESWSLVIGRRF